MRDKVAKVKAKSGDKKIKVKLGSEGKVMYKMLFLLGFFLLCW